MNRTIISVMCVVVAAVASPAADARPRFNPKEVVRRVREARKATDFRPASGPSSDWGEFLLDTNVVCAPAQGDQDMPAIAFDGTSYFVVWHDERNGTYDIYGARVTADGAVMDTAGVAVSTAAYDQLYPSVAFDGSNFLVVWEDGRTEWGDICGARVTREGVVLDPSGITVSSAAYDQRFPAVAFNGANFLVVWQDERSEDFSDIYGARVTRDGAVLDPAGIAISRVVYDQMFPAVGFDGTNWLVVWEDDRNGYGDIYGARMSEAGVVLDSVGIAVSIAADDQGGPGLTSDGTNSLVVWHDARNGGYYDIYAARVTRAGAVLDPTGIAISAAPDDQEWPAAAFDGTNFNVAWQDLREGVAGDIYCARLSTAGTVLDPSGIAVSRTADDQGYPRLAFAGSSFLIVWQDERDDSYSIYGARMRPDGVLLDSSGIALSTTANDQMLPAVGFDGTNFLVVWQDGRGGAYDIYGIRVSQTGMTLDSAAIAISVAAGVQKDAAVGFDGTNFLVAWEDFRGRSIPGIYCARVATSGAIEDPNGIAVCTAANGQWEPTIAFDGTNSLIVWSDLRSGAFDVYGSRVAPTGTVLDPAGITISTEADNQWFPAIAFDGTNYLVAWQDHRGGVSDDIYCARVSRAGVVLDPAGIVISSAVYNQQWPAVAFDGTNFLADWLDARSGSGTDIWGSRVNTEGIVLDTSGFAVCAAGGDQWYPKTTFDGTEFIVTWTDGRTGSATDIYGARVTPGGAVIDNFPVITGEGSQWSGDLAAAPSGQTLLTYGGWAGNVAGKGYNTYRIWGKLGPFPGVAEGQQSRPNTQRMASVARGVLFLPKGTSPSTSWLLDATGRKTAELTPGPNDVSLLPSGVYFVCVGGRTQVQKVVLSR